MPTNLHHKKSPVLRGVSALLAACFLLSDIPLADASQLIPPSKMERVVANPFAFNAPHGYASLEEIHKGSNGHFVIHLQDAHTNLSGQENLAGAMDALMAEYGVSLVFSEGGWGDCSLTPIKHIASSSIWKKVARRFLVTGKIQGEEYLNLVSDRPMKIIGIEDRALYDKSVGVYRELVEKRERALERIRKIRDSIGRLKKAHYPDTLIQYEREKASAPAGDVQGLLSLAERERFDLAEYPELQKLVSLKKREAGIQFDLANLEHAVLMEELTARGVELQVAQDETRLDPASRNKVSQLSYFQNTLYSAQEKNLDVSKYKNLYAYVDYLKDYSQLHVEGLLEEIIRAEEALYLRLLSSRDVRLIRSIDRLMALLDSAHRIQMTARQYTEFRLNEPDFSESRYLSFLNRKLAEKGFFDGWIPVDSVLAEGRSALDEFYGLVAERDEVFIRNLKKSIDENKAKASFLITGGYHTANLKRLLAENGFSYSVLTPIVTQETSQGKYESLLLPSAPARKKIQVQAGEPRVVEQPLGALDADLEKLVQKKKQTLRPSLTLAGISDPSHPPTGSRLAELFSAAGAAAPIGSEKAGQLSNVSSRQVSFRELMELHLVRSDDNPREFVYRRLGAWYWPFARASESQKKTIMANLARLDRYEGLEYEDSLQKGRLNLPVGGARLNQESLKPIGTLEALRGARMSVMLNRRRLISGGLGFAGLAIYATREGFLMGRREGERKAAELLPKPLSERQQEFLNADLSQLPINQIQDPVLRRWTRYRAETIQFLRETESVLFPDAKPEELSALIETLDFGASLVWRLENPDDRPVQLGGGPAVGRFQIEVGTIIDLIGRALAASDESEEKILLKELADLELENIFGEIRRFRSPKAVSREKKRAYADIKDKFSKKEWLQFVAWRLFIVSRVRRWNADRAAAGNTVQTAAPRNPSEWIDFYLRFYNTSYDASSSKLFTPQGLDWQVRIYRGLSVVPKVQLKVLDTLWVHGPTFNQAIALDSARSPWFKQREFFEKDKLQGVFGAFTRLVRGERDWALTLSAVQKRLDNKEIRDPRSTVRQLTQKRKALDKDRTEFLSRFDAAMSKLPESAPEGFEEREWAGLTGKMKSERTRIEARARLLANEQARILASVSAISPPRTIKKQVLPRTPKTGARLARQKNGKAIDILPKTPELETVLDRHYPKRLRRAQITTKIYLQGLEALRRAVFHRNFKDTELLERMAHKIEQKHELVLDKKLGQGGNNAAYLAHHMRTGERYVASFHNPNAQTMDVLDEQDMSGRVRRAIRTVSSLPGMNWEKPHRSIRSIYYFGEIDTVPYAIFNYIEGVEIEDKNIAESLDGKNGPSTAFALFTVPLQLMAALVYMSEHRIIMEREVHTRNVLVDSRQNVSLIDYDDATRDNRDEDSAERLVNEIYRTAVTLIGYLTDNSYITHWRHWKAGEGDALEKAILTEARNRGVLTGDQSESLVLAAKQLAPILKRMLGGPGYASYKNSREVFLDMAKAMSELLGLPVSDSTSDLKGLLRDFFEIDRVSHPRGTFATAMLKGGEIGGMHPILKAKILKRFRDEGFEVFEGAVTHLSIEQALTRWGSGPFKSILEGLREDLPSDLLDSLIAAVTNADASRFKTGLKAAHRHLITHSKNGSAQKSLQRLESMLDYVVRDSQQILLRYKGAKPLPADAQDHVKNLVGRTVDPEPESIRGQVLVPALAPGQLLEGLVEEMKAVHPSLTESEIRITLNGVHTPKKEELGLEFDAMTASDLSLFIWKILEWRTRQALSEVETAGARLQSAAAPEGFDEARAKKLAAQFVSEMEPVIDELSPLVAALEVGTIANGSDQERSLQEIDRLSQKWTAIVRAWSKTGVTDTILVETLTEGGLVAAYDVINGITPMVGYSQLALAEKELNSFVLEGIQRVLVKIKRITADLSSYASSPEPTQFIQSFRDQPRIQIAGARLTAEKLSFVMWNTRQAAAFAESLVRLSPDLRNLIPFFTDTLSHFGANAFDATVIRGYQSGEEAYRPAIRGRAILSEDNFLTLEISDNGPGMGEGMLRYFMESEEVSGKGSYPFADELFGHEGNGASMVYSRWAASRFPARIDVETKSDKPLQKSFTFEGRPRISVVTTGNRSEQGTTLRVTVDLSSVLGSRPRNEQILLDGVWPEAAEEPVAQDRRIRFGRRHFVWAGFGAVGAAAMAFQIQRVFKEAERPAQTPGQAPLIDPQAIQLAAQIHDIQPALLEAFIREEQEFQDGKNSLRKFGENLMEGIARTVGRAQVLPRAHMIDDAGALRGLSDQQNDLASLMQAGDAKRFNEFIEAYRTIGKSKKAWAAYIDKNEGLIRSIAKIDAVNFWLAARFIRNIANRLARQTTFDLPFNRLKFNSSEWLLAEAERRPIPSPDLVADANLKARLVLYRRIWGESFPREAFLFFVASRYQGFDFSRNGGPSKKDVERAIRKAKLAASGSAGARLNSFRERLDKAFYYGPYLVESLPAVQVHSTSSGYLRQMIEQSNGYLKPQPTNNERFVGATTLYLASTPLRDMAISAVHKGGGRPVYLSFDFQTLTDSGITVAPGGYSGIRDPESGDMILIHRWNGYNFTASPIHLSMLELESKRDSVEALVLDAFESGEHIGLSWVYHMADLLNVAPLLVEEWVLGALIGEKAEQARKLAPLLSIIFGVELRVAGAVGSSLRLADFYAQRESLSIFSDFASSLTEEPDPLSLMFRLFSQSDLDEESGARLTVSYQHPDGRRLTPEQVIDENKKAYEANVEPYSKIWAEPTAEIAEFMKQAVEAVPGEVDGIAVDIGTSALGRGAYYLLQNRSWEKVVGVDFSQAHLNRAMERHAGEPKLEFRLADIRDLEALRQAYPAGVQLLWADAVLVHIPDEFLPQVLEQLRSVLAPGGVLALTLKEGEGPAGFVQHPSYPLPRFFNYFSKAKAGRLLAAAGFSAIQIRDQERSRRGFEGAPKDGWIYVLAQNPVNESMVADAKGARLADSARTPTRDRLRGLEVRGALLKVNALQLPLTPLSERLRGARLAPMEVPVAVQAPVLLPVSAAVLAGWKEAPLYREVYGARLSESVVENDTGLRLALDDLLTHELLAAARVKLDKEMRDSDYDFLFEGKNISARIRFTTESDKELVRILHPVSGTLLGLLDITELVQQIRSGAGTPQLQVIQPLTEKFSAQEISAAALALLDEPLRDFSRMKRSSGRVETILFNQSKTKDVADIETHRTFLYSRRALTGKTEDAQLAALALGQLADVVARRSVLGPETIAVIGGGKGSAFDVFKLNIEALPQKTAFHYVVSAEEENPEAALRRDLADAGVEPDKIDAVAKKFSLTVVPKVYDDKSAQYGIANIAATLTTARITARVNLENWAQVDDRVISFVYDMIPKVRSGEFSASEALTLLKVYQPQFGRYAELSVRIVAIKIDQILDFIKGARLAVGSAA